MVDPPVIHKPCCVCDAPGGKHCTKCKSRHYCGKKCQLVDWNERGHKAQCKQLASDFQDRLLDELMPLKIKEAPPIVEDVAPAAGFKVAPRLSAVKTENTAVVKASALNDDAPSWRGTCAICLDVLPAFGGNTFYPCCCKMICTECSQKCWEYDTRCALCRTPASTSDADMLRRLQKQADEGNADAQMHLGDKYRDGRSLKKSLKRAAQLYESAAAQGLAPAQYALGWLYEHGEGVKINFKTAVHWCRRAAEQGLPGAQNHLGLMFYHGKGVVQSYEEAVRWYRLAAAQGDPEALYFLGVCYANGQGVPQDNHEALRFCKRAAAKGQADAAAVVDDFKFAA